MNGGAWQTSGAIVSSLSVGAHTVAFSAVRGWTTPASQSVTINGNQITTTTGMYGAIPQTGLVVNGGFETGDFTGWTLVGDYTNASTTYNAVGSSTDYPSVVHSGNYGAFLGDDKLATLSQTLETVPGQAYLLSFWLDNPTNGPGQEFLVNWIVDGTSTETLYALTNPPVLAWTNPEFIVTAGTGNTILQFGAENVPYGFGLDDISVTPIPMPGFQSIVESNGALSLTWQAASGLGYQVQYKTNLLQAHWINLGTPIIANSTSLTVSDPGANRNSTQRFYRLAVSP